jgi:hypothetical protein
MNKRIKLFIVILLFSACIIFPLGNTEDMPDPDYLKRAELVMKALFEAFNDKIDEVEYRDEDWAVLMNDIWYYYADGKLLPENELINAKKYRPYQFYEYPAELPPQVEASPEDIEMYLRWTSQTGENILPRSGFFPGALWNAFTREEMEEQIVEITFLKKKLKIHKAIRKKIGIIEKEILAAAKTDKNINTWINNLGPLSGYNWRIIANTQSRSYHSYGLAVDLLPKSLGKKQTYWLWASEKKSDWWNVPYSERYHPPEKVIKIFESYGFVWGGKWEMFDTMHFEYRPEVFYLNGMPIKE